MQQRPYTTYPGGKNGSGVYQAIINQIPPHDVFITAFAGNCAVLANKLPAPAGSIAIDADAAVAHKWAMLASNTETGDTDRASPVDHTAFSCDWIYSQENAVLTGITAIHGDALELLPAVIAKYNDGCRRIFIFCDPPYLAEVRKSKRPLYHIELQTLVQHQQLLDLLTQINAMSPAVMLMLTHYPCQFWDDGLTNWRRMDIRGQSRQGSTVERLYMNYPEPSQLHDVRYYGSNFRHRELLKKAAKNLNRKFQKWSPLDQQYFFYHLNLSAHDQRPKGAGTTRPDHHAPQRPQ